MVCHLDLKQWGPNSALTLKTNRHKHTKPAAKFLGVSLIFSATCAVYMCFSGIKARRFGSIRARASVLCSLGLALWVSVASPLAARVHLLRGYGRPELTDGRPSPFRSRVTQ